MPTRASAIPYVILCDPRGSVVWTNNSTYEPHGQIWEFVAEDNRELLKDKVARAAFLREPQALQITTDHAEVHRVWVWPIMESNLGICLVGLRVPQEILRLTERERECLERLSIGRSAVEIAEEFNVSVSTVHTFMKRSRDKLELTSMEQLIAFASRYFPPLDSSFPQESRHDHSEVPTSGLRGPVIARNGLKSHQ
jgi:DNA-binding CsgD family transcriptional regulator